MPAATRRRPAPSPIAPATATPRKRPQPVHGQVVAPGQEGDGRRWAATVRAARGAISTASPGASRGTMPVYRRTWYQSKTLALTYHMARTAGRTARTYRGSRRRSTTRPATAASITGCVTNRPPRASHQGVDQPGMAEAHERGAVQPLVRHQQGPPNMACQARTWGRAATANAPARNPGPHGRGASVGAPGVSPARGRAAAGAGRPATGPGTRGRRRRRARPRPGQRRDRRLRADAGRSQKSGPPRRTPGRAPSRA